MVAIEHRQKSAIVATDTTTPSTPTSTTTTTPTESAIEISTPTRRSSDVENSNDIAPPSTNSSEAATATATTTTAAATKDNEEKEEEEILNLDQGLNTKMSESSSEASTVTVESAAAQMKPKIEPTVSKSAVSQRYVDIKIAKKSNKDAATQELNKKILKLDLTGKDLDEFSIKSPRSPIATRLPHQASLSTVDVEDRKTLREALYQGIFHRHRRTIFAVGSFLRMLRSRNSSYNTIRSSEGEDVDEAR